MQTANELTSRDPQLNVFASFERNAAGEIENNYTRALLVALLHLAREGRLGAWLRQVMPADGPLRARCERAAAELDKADDVKGGLLRWPAPEDDALRILVGISGSGGRRPEWVAGTRISQGESYPDAWLGAPGVQIVIEAKSESGGLDGAQIVRQTRTLQLLGAEADAGLRDPADPAFGAEDAKHWQAALCDRVLDIGWDSVLAGLHVAVRGSEGSVGGYITRQALDWMEDEGLGGFDGIDGMHRRIARARGQEISAKPTVGFLRLRDAVRRGLRDLAARVLERVGNVLELADDEVHISMLDPGDVSIRFRPKGKQRTVSLWADLSGKQGGHPIGVSVYEEASGVNWPDEEPGFAGSWQAGHGRLTKCRLATQARWASGLKCIPDLQDVEVTVFSLGFRGNKRNWQGGGSLVATCFTEPALAFLQHTPGSASRVDGAWAFPMAAQNADREIARQSVRKPAISVRIGRPIPPDATVEDAVAMLADDLVRLSAFLD